MATAPVYHVNIDRFRHDPYPVLADMRANAPIANVPELGGIAFTRRDDIFKCEKNIKIFSSHQPAGLMNRLMGHNMMRKDGEDHLRERKIIFPSISPKTVRDVWTAKFQTAADRILDAFQADRQADLVSQYALPLSGEALKEMTGLTHIGYQEMDAWSQAMIDGIANYQGDPEIEARCRAATARIDDAISQRIEALVSDPDFSLLSIMLQSELSIESTRANIKLAISGGQNEPRDAIAGCAWALMRHPDQLQMVLDGEVSWRQAFEEYARWISPIGMSPRRVASHYRYSGIDFSPEDKVFFMFGSANRDEAVFAEPQRFDITRDLQKSIPFGAGPHFCAGAWASRALIADVALPALFGRLDGLSLDPEKPAEFTGWAFRGPKNVSVMW